ncbi:MAG: ATP-binding cassette domain-containing protein, partial [Muribaculaceae bacterium]|nr:ATP-binding cassette domain-containing protein [Muribaculaceae bacterium]
MPDTQIKEREEDIFLATPDGVLEEEVIEAEPEKGILRTKDLVKKYGKRTVANKVSIYVKQGEIVGLLGPNGAGKTTT